MAAEAAGLFGSPSNKRGHGQEEIAATAATDRRTKLRKYDRVAAQALNPDGVSVIKDCSLKALWDSATHGNKAVHFYTELAALAETGGPYRVGIGVSRTAGIVKEAINMLKGNDYKRLMNKQLYDKAMTEALELEQPLNILDFGKGSVNAQQAGMTFGRMRTNSTGGTTPQAPSTGDVERAAKSFFAWLQKGDASPLRGMLAILSAGGVFYAAHCAEKTARAWKDHKPASEADCIEAVLARAATQPAQEEAAPRETTGLFG